MAERIALEVEFKGARQYVHGTDLFERCTKALRTRFGAGYVARLELRRVARRQCDLLLGEAGPAEACGAGAYSREPGGTRKFWLQESARPVTGRYAFDEDALVAPAAVDAAQRIASLPARSGRAPIEEAIALTKLLNYRVMPQVRGQWLFARAEFARALEDGYTAMSVRMKSAIPGRFSVSELRLDGDLAGRIDFVVGTP